MGKFDSFFDDAVVNAKAAANAVSKKAVTFYDASKHKISAAEIRGEINKKLKELGKVTYKSEVHGADLFAEKEQLITEIKELIESLNVINGHIAAIKSQRKCPSCEARVPKNSIYCNICGTKLEDASAEQSVMSSDKTPEAPKEEPAPAEEPAPVEKAAPVDEAAAAVEEAAVEAAEAAKEAVSALEEAVSEAAAPVEEAAADVQAAAVEAAENVAEAVAADEDSNEDLFV